MRTTRLLFLTVGMIAGLLLGVPMTASAASEFVTVVKVLSNDDHGIIMRSNGNAYQIEKGVGCLSFWRYEDKQVLVSSPGLFLGVGSELILPDDNQKCRIWDSKELGRWGSSGAERPSERSKPAPSKPAPSRCIDGHWISTVSGDGQIVMLEDRSIWEVDPVDAINSMLWLPTQRVLICSARMINTSNGKAIRATRLK